MASIWHLQLAPIVQIAVEFGLFDGTLPSNANSSREVLCQTDADEAISSNSASCMTG